MYIHVFYCRLHALDVTKLGLEDMSRFRSVVRHRNYQTKQERLCCVIQTLLCVIHGSAAHMFLRSDALTCFERSL
jgi:hypothetical protein